MVSPSTMLCAGRMVRARPSWAMDASFLARAFVSRALVAITPMVVLFAKTSFLLSQAAMTASSVPRNRRPALSRAPATIMPVRGSITSPRQLTAISAPTARRPDLKA